MPFTSPFTNPFEDPRNVPTEYRRHPSLQALFTTSGAYVRPAEDPVTVWAIDLLYREYGVPLDALELELHTDFAPGVPRGERRYLGRADVVVYDDRYSATGLDVAFIMVEAMEPGKRFEGDEAEGWNEHLRRLQAYMSASPSARYSILTSGIHTAVFRRDLGYPRQMEQIGDLPLYESARAAAQHSEFTVVLNPDVPDGIVTGLRPLTRDKFREVLGDTRSGCHSILRDNEGLQPQEAVDAMVKFLFAKWYDEQATVTLAKESNENRAYVFSVTPQTDPQRLVTQVRTTFDQAKEWEREILSKKFGDNLNTRLAFGEADALQLKPHTTVEIVKRLQSWSLRRSSSDVKGAVFEDFLSKTFRDDLGQYFTPTPVIKLMVDLLQPSVDDYIGDPACGSARMLTHALEHVRDCEYDEAIEETIESSEDVNREEPTQAFIEFRDNHLFGAELSPNVMHVARVNTLMNGAQYADLRVMDSLERLSVITGGASEGLPSMPGFYPGGLTMIVTNPPFGSAVTNPQVLADFASRDGLSKRNGRVIRSLPQELAFLNRCLEYLVPGGRLAIVLPDGVLANRSLQFARDWILRFAKLKAVVSLPQPTFAPYGAAVNTSVVLLEKRVQPLPELAQLADTPSKKRRRTSQDGLQELPGLSGLAGGATDILDSRGNPSASEIDLEEDDYSVYMARLDDIGYDATGRLTVPADQASRPPEISTIIEEFHRLVGWGDQ